MRALLGITVLSPSGQEILTALIAQLRRLNGAEQEAKADATKTKCASQLLLSDSLFVLDRLATMKTGSAFLVEDDTTEVKWSPEGIRLGYCMDSNLGLGAFMPFDARSRAIAGIYLSSLSRWQDPTATTQSAGAASSATTADSAYGFCDGVDAKTDFRQRFIDTFRPTAANMLMPRPVESLLNTFIPALTKGTFKSADCVIQGAFTLQLANILCYDQMADNYQRRLMATSPESTRNQQARRNTLHEFLIIRLRLKSGEDTDAGLGAFTIKFNACFPSLLSADTDITNIEIATVIACFAQQSLAWYRERDSLNANGIEMDEFSAMLATAFPINAWTHIDPETDKQTSDFFQTPLNNHLQHAIVEDAKHDAMLNELLLRLSPSAKPIDVTVKHYQAQFDKRAAVATATTNGGLIESIRFYLSTCYADQSRSRFMPSIDDNKKAAIARIIEACNAVAENPLDRSAIHNLIQTFHNERFRHMIDISYHRQSYGRYSGAFLAALPAINALSRSIQINNNPALYTALAEYRPATAAGAAASAGTFAPASAAPSANAPLSATAANVTEEDWEVVAELKP